jgi:hypothetical protein
VGMRFGVVEVSARQVTSLVVLAMVVALLAA